MPLRAKALEAVKVGDLVFGLGAGDQEKLLLVYRVDRQGFSARHVTTQMNWRFNRDGRTKVYADGGYVTIVSTAPLPPELHAVAIGLDRKFAGRPDYPDSVLTKEEIDLLLTYKKHFYADLLPMD